MSHDTGRTVTVDQRRFTRVPHRGSVSYRYAANEGATAECLDVSHGGACLAMGRYLRPGRFVMLGFAPAREHGAAVELKAQIVWCRAGDEPHEFHAGLHIFQDEPEVSTVISELIYVSLVQTGHIQSEEGVNPGRGWSVDGKPSPSPFVNESATNRGARKAAGSPVAAPRKENSVHTIEKAVV